MALFTLNFIVVSIKVSFIVLNSHLHYYTNLPKSISLCICRSWIHKMKIANPGVSSQKNDKSTRRIAACSVINHLVMQNMRLLIVCISDKNSGSIALHHVSEYAKKNGS